MTTNIDQCRKALESIRDLSRNHGGAVALARHWLSLLYGVPATEGRPSSTFRPNDALAWESAFAILSSLPVNAEVEVGGFKWKRRNFSWLEGPDGGLYDNAAAANVVARGSI